jgi:uncharacterized HAD superfamily protein
MSEKELRIGLDVDGVLSNFSAGVIKLAKEKGFAKHFPECCHDVTSWDMSEEFSEVMSDAWRDEKFWLELPALTDSVPFTPYCYITSRRVPSEVTAQWLKNNGFPEAPVITVSNPSEKIHWIEEHKLDLFVDDLYSTVRELRDAGYNSVLFEAPYQVGHVKECEGLPKIKSLNEVVPFLKSLDGVTTGRRSATSRRV